MSRDRLAELSRLIAGLAVYISCTCLAQAEMLSGRVVKIADGDTLTVLDKSNRQHKIRLLGIDAPEHAQPFGTVSRQNLADLVFGKTVAVEWYKQDRYQRILGKVLLNGQDVNLKQIKAGLAWHYKQYDKDLRRADKQLYAEAQKAASLKGIGLWNDVAPVAPWDFRHNKSAPSVADDGCEIRLGEFRYKIDPVICGIFRNALKSASTLPGLMELVHLATRPGSREAN
ncbi:thermonuclease family protein [Nitrosospira multiformis]|uniref:Endonuclease YncB, thermonuclease family n=2 Tax=Nitrosospira multiformis TaxID=1231 RepID=Q2Y7H3_NITMU|nr:thermonuclease family protein [Nitrosospira multiformis]ABB75298.1 nuclease (SNase-like) [Nitrosospira multiformis ATCC 25196]SDZ93315.1 Endonuclease YncB, thermonuclease family [Nitrosospira multiformis]SEF58403.1 Endonuclease YncB, thermonuclease family [Nitrosospira multiformis ATCC 25196]